MFSKLQTLLEKLNNTLNLTKMSVIIRNSLNPFKCFYMKHLCLIFRQFTKFQDFSQLKREKNEFKLLSQVQFELFLFCGSLEMCLKISEASQNNRLFKRHICYISINERSGENRTLRTT